jgi:hypothetical protein
MSTWMRRVRGAVGMGLTWAVAWSGAGAMVSLGFVLRTGSPPDAPFPLMFAAAGFIAGLIFSGVLRIAEGRRRFDELSLARFASWGAIGGFSLATMFFTAVSLAGDSTFIRYLIVVGPLFALAGAGSAAGSLALARRAQNRELPGATEDMTMQLPDAEIRTVLPKGR